jgi:hypothetical protein
MISVRTDRRWVVCKTIVSHYEPQPGRSQAKALASSPISRFLVRIVVRQQRHDLGCVSRHRSIVDLVSIDRDKS